MARKKVIKDSELKTCTFEQAEDEEFYVDLEPAIDGNDCQWYVFYSGRSDGKTFSSIYYALKQYIRSGYQHQTGYVRRMPEDFKEAVKRQKLFDGVVKFKSVSKMTNGRFDSILYTSGGYYLARYDEDLDKYVREDSPFMMLFFVSVQLHYKSSTLINMDTIIYDEFLLPNGGYIPDEFIALVSLMSSIFRKRPNTKIIMLANTVDMTSIYFREMGIQRQIRQLEQGTAQIFESKRGTRVYVEYIASTNRMSKTGNVERMYGFDNPKLEMVLNGAFEIAMYPHKPFEFDRSNVRYTFFIHWAEEIKRCQVVSAKDPDTDVKCDFLYISKYLSDNLEDLPKNKLVYTTGNYAYPNYRRKITRPQDKLENTIADFFRREKVFFEDNTTGNDINDYIKWCGNRDFMHD